MKDSAHPSVYMVFVDENKLGEFADCESAMAACKELVDEFFAGRNHLTAEEQFSAYCLFGAYPYISSDDPKCAFSGWSYAKQRCTELARQMPAVYTVLVDDNYDPLDRFDRYKLGHYPDCASAVAACQTIVYESLAKLSRESADDLLDQYRKYGKTPSIQSGDKSCVFRALSYAEQHCLELAAKQEEKE